MGIGACAATIPSVWLGWPPWVTIPLGAVAATILGAIIAYPFARLRAVYYAMGTLFLGYVVMNLITAGGKTTGMSTGLGGVQPLFSSRTLYYYLGLGLMLLSLVCMYRFEFSRIGVRMKAVAQSTRWRRGRYRESAIASSGGVRRLLHRSPGRLLRPLPGSRLTE
jgi:branched-chain amino acid transport system permease protein